MLNLLLIKNIRNHSVNNSLIPCQTKDKKFAGLQSKQISFQLKYFTHWNPTLPEIRNTILYLQITNHTLSDYMYIE